MFEKWDKSIYLRVKNQTLDFSVHSTETVESNYLSLLLSHNSPYVKYDKHWVHSFLLIIPHFPAVGHISQSNWKQDLHDKKNFLRSTCIFYIHIFIIHHRNAYILIVTIHLAYTVADLMNVLFKCIQRYTHGSRFLDYYCSITSK